MPADSAVTNSPRIPGAAPGHQTRLYSKVKVAVWHGTPQHSEALRLIRRWQKLRGVDNRDLAQRMGVGKTSLKKWIYTDSFPAYRLAKAEEVLEMPPGVLTNLATPRFVRTARELDGFFVEFESMRQKLGLSQIEIFQALEPNLSVRASIEDGKVLDATSCDLLDHYFECEPGRFLALSRDRYLTRLWNHFKPTTVLGKYLLSHMAKQLIDMSTMAERLNVDRSSVNNWVRGRFQATPPHLKTIARRFGKIPQTDRRIVKPGGFFRRHLRRLADDKSSQHLLVFAISDTLPTSDSTIINKESIKPVWGFVQKLAELTPRGSSGDRFAETIEYVRELFSSSVDLDEELKNLGLTDHVLSQSIEKWHEWIDNSRDVENELAIRQPPTDTMNTRGLERSEYR